MMQALFCHSEPKIEVGVHVNVSPCFFPSHYYTFPFPLLYMTDSVLDGVKSVLKDVIGAGLLPDPIPDDFPLAGNVLDSMAIATLIVGLEEHFGIVFNDDDLTVEAFSDPVSLASLVTAKIASP